MAADLRSDETKYWHAEIARAVERERERCAKVADNFASQSSAGVMMSMAESFWGESHGKAIAALIRNRPTDGTTP